MSLQLWDAHSANLINRFSSEDEAVAWVAANLEDGDEWALVDTGPPMRKVAEWPPEPES